MSNFSAEIQAKLNTSGIPSEIKKIEDNKISFKNISLDTTKLVSDIQAALNKNRFTINLDKVNMSSVTSQMQKSSAEAGKNFSSSLSSALNNIHLKNGGIANISKMLQGAGFDKSSIASVTKELDKMVLTISKISTKQLNNGNIRMTITGIDELNRAVQVVRDFDETTGQVSNTTKTFVQSFDTGAAAAKRLEESAKKATTAFNSGSIEASIAKANAQYEKFGNTGHSKLTEIKTDIKELSELQTAMDSSIKSGNSLSLGSNYEEFNKTLARVKNNLLIVSSAERKKASADKEAADAAILLNKSQKLSNDITDWMTKNKKAAEIFGDRLRDLQEQLDGGLDPKGFQKVSSEFAKIKSEAKATGIVLSSFKREVKEAVLQLLGLGSSVMILQKAIQIFKAMYQNVYNIDTAMTNLYKVTDATDAKYQKFLRNANISAQELGRTVSSLVEQTANWAKLGYSLDESANLAKLSSVYANVAEVDDKTAVSDIVTAMKAFNIEANNAIKIIDPLNELGNKFATSAGDLGNGLSVSASAMKLAGSDIYETLAMITGGAEITQNASEFGNALKIASMRIRGMKGELEELGEEVDGSVDSISKVQTQILNITKGKVNIFDDAGEFRNYYEIMKDISKVYNDLSSTEQASLMEILFGKQRGNQGAALIQAFQSGQIEKAYETAKNSAGSAMAEQEKWMESLEAKTAQLKAAWEELSQVFLDDSFLKGLVDAGTTVLSILTKIIDTIEALPTLIAGVAAGMSIRKNFGRDKMFSFFLNMPTTMCVLSDMVVFI